MDHSSQDMHHTHGVLLVNLGTPDEASPAAIKRFLNQFLSDKRVVSIPSIVWKPLLNGVILPLRSPKVAKVYQQVWMEEGSPLMVYAKRQAAELKKKLNIPVEIGMTYGNPSIEAGLEALKAQGCNDITVLPLYPQYSSTTTAAVSDALNRVLQKSLVIPSYRLIREYYHHPLFIKALASKVKQHWQEHGQGDYLLCSYHGIPKRLVDQGDVYSIHCEQTTKLLQQELGLTPEQMGMSYQSRFGKEEWLQPYTDKTLEGLAKKKMKSLDVISPAFACDCIETLEEIAIECKDIYQQAGGQEYRYIECLNDSPEHIELMEALIKGE
ncbi:ferrochelatase [Vibrio rumoiensis]|uniref:Ferrochelatase n=1 Tax=Vibrio rumoiensis 1S-45 TaxID=1188252 RepID=A0A1E5E1A9_9VIBR|nr:ferrochelatase [Vibrio rumoiensis]OEF24007.1 ferrochelatase [Vibrio rumoiensis 1S-45]